MQEPNTGNEVSDSTSREVRRPTSRHICRHARASRARRAHTMVAKVPTNHSVMNEERFPLAPNRPSLEEHSLCIPGAACTRDSYPRGREPSAPPRRRQRCDIPATHPQGATPPLLSAIHSRVCGAGPPLRWAPGEAMQDWMAGQRPADRSADARADERFSHALVARLLPARSLPAGIGLWRGEPCGRHLHSRSLRL